MAEHLMGKWLIVCVDDDESILSAVGRTLRREPSFEVRTTMDVQQVLEWIHREDVAVLVSDYEMPEITGAQLAGIVKNIRPETVRILLTGRRTLDTAIDGINQGEIFRFLSKPFEDKQLRQAVLDAAKRHDELRELSGDRQRRERREQLLAALEQEYPGITKIHRRTNDVVVVTDDPWTAAAELGIVELDKSLESS
jgi:two-component system, probable response regulator PhcQ